MRVRPRLVDSEYPTRGLRRTSNCVGLYAAYTALWRRLMPLMLRGRHLQHLTRGGAKVLRPGVRTSPHLQAVEDMLRAPEWMLTAPEWMLRANELVGGPATPTRLTVDNNCHVAGRQSTPGLGVRVHQVVALGIPAGSVLYIVPEGGVEA
eukprot:9493361-Pyramimonas_sp.AAC.1